MERWVVGLFAHYRLIIDINGYYAQAADTSDNIAIGRGALFNNIASAYNTAIGANALETNTNGWEKYRHRNRGAPIQHNRPIQCRHWKRGAS
jgi:hypothetical protein